MSKFMDVLGDVSDSSDSTSEEEAEPAEQKPRKKQAIELKTLEQCGYKSGPSVLFVPEPKPEGQTDWQWSGGDRERSAEPEETIQERVAIRRAANDGAEETAQAARLAREQAKNIKQEAIAERARLAEERRLTFRQKEKRKRDLGQAKSGKNYVEEEKRLARNLGVYSGFDT